jgi:uncharacterized protein YfaS (alpha-2-macroglobulin family)
MSTINEYALGTNVTVSAIFKTALGVAADPTAVFFSVKDPEGTQSDLTYGDDVEVVKDSTGHYHVDVDANIAGTWLYRFFSTGTGKAAAEGSFTVSPSNF